MIGFEPPALGFRSWSTAVIVLCLEGFPGRFTFAVDVTVSKGSSVAGSKLWFSVFPTMGWDGGKIPGAHLQLVCMFGFGWIGD